MLESQFSIISPHARPSRLPPRFTRGKWRGAGGLQWKSEAGERGDCAPVMLSHFYVSFVTYLHFRQDFNLCWPLLLSPPSLASCHSSSFQLFSAVSICIFCEATATATGHYISDLDESKMERKRLHLLLFLCSCCLFPFLISREGFPLFSKSLNWPVMSTVIRPTRVCIAPTRRYSLTHACIPIPSQSVTRTHSILPALTDRPRALAENATLDGASAV